MTARTRRQKIEAVAATADYNPAEAAVAVAKLSNMPTVTLPDIAEQIKDEWGKGVESQFAIGHLLVQARALLPSDPAFGGWLKEQSFPFTPGTARLFRLAAEREDEVRGAITAFLGTGKEVGVVMGVKSLLGYLKPTASEPKRERDEATDDPGFSQVRAGIHALLGWVVDDEGEGEATKNGLLLLPNDQLVELKALVEALAKAYGEAARARRPA